MYYLLGDKLRFSYNIIFFAVNTCPRLIRFLDKYKPKHLEIEENWSMKLFKLTSGYLSNCVLSFFQELHDNSTESI